MAHKYVGLVHELREWLMDKPDYAPVAVQVEPDMETKLVVKNQMGGVEAKCSLDSEEAE